MNRFIRILITATFLLMLTNSFSKECHTLNTHLYPKTAGFSFNEDCGIVLDINSWDKTTKGEYEYYNHLRSSNTIVVNRDSGELKEVAQDAGSNYSFWRFKNSALQSFTLCIQQLDDGVQSCRTVNKALCDNLMKAMGVKTTIEAQAKLLRCDAVKFVYSANADQILMEEDANIQDIRNIFKKNIKVNGSLTHDVLKSMKGLDLGMLYLKYFIDECDMGFSNEDVQKKKEISKPVTTVQGS